jgi:hypothetical protein
MDDYKNSREYRELKSRFDIYYIEKLLPLLKKTEKFRSKYVRSFWTLLAHAVILYPLLILVIFNIKWSEDSPQLGMIISLSAVVVAIVSSPIYKYKKRAKNSGIMKEFASFFGTFDYNFEMTIPDEILKYSHIFKNYTINEGDDFFAGSYKGVGITISEEKLQKEIYINNRRKKVKVFKGICVMLDMNKPFKGRTVALKDGGMLNILKRIPNLERVSLEDLHFEKFLKFFFMIKLKLVIF